MKKLSTIFVSLFILICISCSSDEETNIKGNDEISNNPVSGKLYGSSFTMNSSKARNAVVFGNESVEVYLSSQNLGCGILGTSGYPIYIVAPRTVGTHTSNVYVTFNDPNSSGFISISSGVTVEIISINGTTVIGKVRATSQSTVSEINGKFESTFCD
jgi:hypothetical protein